MNTKKCAEVWQGLVARKLIHIAKFVTGRVHVVGSLWREDLAGHVSFFKLFPVGRVNE
jgi:hypothetical protein